jgi:hypothetical protein
MFTEVDCTIAEYNAIVQKSVLTHEDLQKFASYTGDVDFDTKCEINKRVIQNNDVDGWELLCQAEYYYGFHPAFDICLELAVKYGNYSIVCHIINAYVNYAKLEHGDPLCITELQLLATNNPNPHVRTIVEQIIALIPGDELTEELGEQYASNITRYINDFNKTIYV